MTQYEIDHMRAHGCTVIEATDCDVEHAGTMGRTIKDVLDIRQSMAGKGGIGAIAYDGQIDLRRDDALSYVRVLKDGDWRKALGLKQSEEAR